MDDVERILASAYEADQFVLKAHELDDPMEVRDIAMRALDMNALSVNAWCLLASLETGGSDVQIDLYHRAVSAASTLAGRRLLIGRAMQIVSGTPGRS